MDNVMQNGNPAARLLELVLDLKSANRAEKGHKVWATVFETDGDLALTHERLSKMMRLSEETHDLMLELFPRQERSTRAWKEKLDSAFFNQSLTGAFHLFIDYIDDVTVDYLSAAVDLLESKAPKTLSPQEIGEFIKVVNSLISEVMDGDFESKVKEYLVRTLRKIVTALEEYRLTGSIPITDSIEQALGHSFFDKDYRNALENTDTGKKILSALGDLANAVTVATPVVTVLLTETVKQALGFQG